MNFIYQNKYRQRRINLEEITDFQTRAYFTKTEEIQQAEVQSEVSSEGPSSDKDIFVLEKYVNLDGWICYTESVGI